MNWDDCLFSPPRENFSRPIMSSDDTGAHVSITLRRTFNPLNFYQTSKRRATAAIMRVRIKTLTIVLQQSCEINVYYCSNHEGAHKDADYRLAAVM